MQAISIGLGVIVTINFTLLLGLNRHRTLGISGLIAAVIYIVSSITLYDRLGFYAVALATLAANLALIFTTAVLSILRDVNVPNK